MQSTRPKIETSVKREKQGFTMDNRKKSLTGLTGSDKVEEAKPKRNVSPRKVISFSMLDEGDISNADTNSQLRLHEY